MTTDRDARLKTANELAEMVRTETRAEKRAAVVRDFIENSYSMGSADEETMLLLVEAYVTDPPTACECPSLMRLHQDESRPEEAVAKKVVAHMLEAGRYGDTVGLRLAVMRLEALAAEIIFGTKAEWQESLA